MAANKKCAMLSGAIVTLAAALPLESTAQSGNVTLYGRVNMTMGSIGSSPAFGVRETATGNVPVTSVDSHVHGNGWTVGAGSRIGVRGVEDLGSGLRAGFWFEASGSTGDTTSSAVVAPGTDRTRIWYLTPSPFGTNPDSIGLGLTGLDSTVETSVKNYIGKAIFGWPEATLSDAWNIRWRPSIGLHDYRNKFDFTAIQSSPTFGTNLLSSTTVQMRDSYIGVAGGLGVTWLPGRGPRDIPPVGQFYPVLLLDGDVALLRRDSSRHADQTNVCAVQPCGAGENFTTGIDSLNNGWTWSANVRLEGRLGYAVNPWTTMYASVAGGWNYVNELSRFNTPVTTGSQPAHFSLGSGYQRYLGAGVGLQMAF